MTFNHKLNDKLDIVCYTTHGNQEQLLLQKGKKIMRIIASAFVYMSECKASFHCEEYGFAKHAHFQDKQNRYGMIS